MQCMPKRQENGWPCIALPQFLGPQWRQNLLGGKVPTCPFPDTCPWLLVPFSRSPSVNGQIPKPELEKQNLAGLTWNGSKAWVLMLCVARTLPTATTTKTKTYRNPHKRFYTNIIQALKYQEHYLNRYKNILANLLEPFVFIRFLTV